MPNASTKVGESPRLNEVVERSVGEVIYETYNYQQFEGAKLAGLPLLTFGRHGGRSTQ